MNPLSDIRTDLLALQNVDGGWGAFADRPSDAEATALAVRVLASGDAGTERALGAGLDWLAAQQRDTGVVPVFADAPDSGWTTGLAALAFDASAQTRRNAARARDWLVGEKGKGYPWYMTLTFRIFPNIKDVETDIDIPAWPWNHDTTSWIEPTSYAVLALKAVPAAERSSRVRKRIEEAEAMYRDRVCRNGGWNHGNAVILGSELPPYPDTTAWVLLSLRDTHPSDLTVSGIDSLDRMLRENDSSLTSALAGLVRRAYGLPMGDVPGRLEAAYGENRFRGSTRTLALAALALDGRDPLTARAS